MELVNDIAFIGTWIFVVIFLIGIIRPHIVLIWTENKDRSMVIKIFGTLAAICLLTYFVTAPSEESEKGIGKQKETNDAVRDAPIEQNEVE